MVFRAMLAWEDVVSTLIYCGWFCTCVSGYLGVHLSFRFPEGVARKHALRTGWCSHASGIPDSVRSLWVPHVPHASVSGVRPPEDVLYDSKGPVTFDGYFLDSSVLGLAFLDPLRLTWLACGCSLLSCY